MISILIPVYNVSRYILRCLESVAAQSYSGDIECVLIDDCGQDDSIAIAEDYIAHQSSHIKFRIIHHNQNRGLAAARNTGISAARGEFVMHLDSDDWLESNAVALLANKQQETDADIVSGNAMAHYNDKLKLFEEPEYTNNMDMVLGTIQMTMDHVIWRRLIRKRLYTDHDIKAIEGVNIGEDHHTLPRLAYFAKKIAKVDAIIYHYNCMNPNSYMQMTNYKICMSRYFSDCKSIQILKDFFSDKNKGIETHLDAIERNYKINTKRRAVQLGDHNNYILICNDLHITAHYKIERIRLIISNNILRLKKLLKSYGIN